MEHKNIDNYCKSRKYFYQSANMKGNVSFEHRIKLKQWLI